MSEEFDAPKWDVALEALLNEEYAKKQEVLRLDDLRRLAVLHAIRFDDILDTLMIMCIHNAWYYEDADGVRQEITQETYDELFKTGRTAEEDIAPYTGGWGKAA